MKTSFAVALSAVMSLAVAQSTTNSTVNPAAIDVGTRVSWCTAEFNTCPLLCPSSNAKTNNCDYNNLTYSCVCADGTTPDLASYMATMPFFLCQQSFSDCIKQNENNAQGQAGCTATYKCGTKNATSASPVASSSSSSAVASSTGSATSSPAASATKNAAVSDKMMVGSGLFAGILMLAANALL